MNICRDCGGTREKGWLLDHDGKSSLSRQLRWVRGDLGSQSLLDTLFQRAAAQNIQETLPVTTWRCTQCGRLESFAFPEK